MLVKPTLIVPHVTDIPLDELLAMSVTGFIFDLDNTLIPPNHGVLDDVIRAWLALTESKGFKSVVVSNNPIKTYTDLACEVLNMPVVGNAGKPRLGGLRQGLDHLGLDAHQVAVVGDRPLTDIWGGQRLGAKTILVDPLLKHQEHVIIKVLRQLERSFVHP